MKSFEIIQFCTISKDILKRPDGKFVSYNNEYSTENMLRHEKIFSIKRINYIINDRWNAHVLNVTCKRITPIYTVKAVKDTKFKSIDNIIGFQILKKDDTTETLILNDKIELLSVKNLYDFKKAIQKPKDIKDEECLSINEIQRIIGDLEDCGKQLITYVKKKLNK